MDTKESAPQASSTAIDAPLREAADRLAADAAERRSMAARLAKLASLAASGDLAKLGKEVERTRAAVDDAALQRTGAATLLARLDAEVAEAPARLRADLSRSLQAACAAAGLDLRVVSREEPLELRIVPFSVVLDLAAGQATLRFAREPLLVCPARADAILATREKLLSHLDDSFDAERFFDQCHRAYRAGLAAEGKREGDRLELLQFLPYLAVLRQSRAFHANPVAKGYQSYGRARFAWEVMRLREAGGLARRGLRLNLGVATGTSASEKGRALYVEDGQGTGEYKLTIFFVRAEPETA